ncbi:UDP-N-acetylmuramoyl-tripeptide--D-alanyl-D-alanine ligase [Halomicronema hongdechloris C2206]|uniref:UDP-N-acetylmuramoyl-tripeptide--D-alanyl-D-alanine ligase n=1 Tax=Halomicronema hongdechloris C2206 TaxID=1641165 RepID=A0A1Z3HG27_9CYAN|nr:UDP-N-acetylmuramoyl-tripeptide--D-alanyl-D-alanine ligase [Halomicronema hongdechloris]ASC69242.1 UDP-N-acetylmuramoyl-tripeptide--D-alanyl-D-alanine ligase [Halomicronema hongdechloris C2206]
MGFRATLEQILQITAAILREDAGNLDETWLSHISTDSRDLPEGSLFIALSGDRFDGHDFVSQALAQGAVAAMVHKPIDGAVTGPLLSVPDTLQAYQALGRWWRQQLGLPLVAITGSVGKTTTKELLAAVLSHYGPVLKSEANHNNEIGVPKTLLNLTSAHAYGVVEMGMRGPGEIALLSQIAQPDIAVITNVGTAHIGRLGSEQAIAEAKCELLATLRPEGTAILNHDNARLMRTAARVWSGRSLTFGLEGGDVQGHFQSPDQVFVDGVRLPLPLPGRHNALNYLAAIAVLQALELDWRFLTAGISLQLPSGRARRVNLSSDVVILDETYNAGVESMSAALRLLADTPGQRRIAVLGTMKELGEYSLVLHHDVGKAVYQLGIDRLLILADPAEAEAMAVGALPLQAECFDQAEALTRRLMEIIQPGDRLLFKASRAVALDRVIDQLGHSDTDMSLRQR